MKDRKPEQKTGNCRFCDHKHNTSSLTQRRSFLMATGSAIALGAASTANAGCDRPGEFKIYDQNTRLKLSGPGDQIIEKAYNLGHDFHSAHGGCARCVVAALQEAMEMVPDDAGLFRSATCLDAGAAPGTLLSCGCFTGAGIVIGYICGGEDFQCRDLAHSLIQKLAVIYQDKFGSVLCKDALEHGNCRDLVGLTAKWTAQILLEQFTDYRKS